MTDEEERLRLLLDRVPVMLWSARPDTTLDYLNGTCATFTGMPIEKMRDEGWLNALHPEDRDGATATYTPAIEARRPFTMEYRAKRADGAWRWLLSTGVPRYDGDGAYVGYVGCAVDITERKEAEDHIHESRAALRVSHEEIQQLAGRLLTAHEDERRRLARELHDDITQRLARFSIDIGRIERGAGAIPGLKEVREGLVHLSEDVHDLSYRLHPSVLDDLGLVEALRAECDRVVRHDGLRVDVDANDVPDALPPETSLCLFRVAQEALSNTVRHARASAVTVLLFRRDDGVQLAVRDNGGGYETGAPRQRASLGLASMRERVRLANGEIDIKSIPGEGTTVVAWVPA